MNIRMSKKGDLVLIVCIVIIAGLTLAWNTYSSSSSSDAITAVITQDGKVIKSINLNTVNSLAYVNINNHGIQQVIVAEKRRIRFLESNCRDKTCVKTGWLTETGDKAVCMPSATIITIVGDHKDIDSITY
ncbi:MAG: NusG domain II-containing protein [Desulfosporosinus sp.]